jgi:hypothetical protein
LTAIALCRAHPFHSGADLSRPYIGGENRSKSSTRCIRFAQHATDLGAPSIPMGRWAVYYRRGSAKVFHSIPFHSGADLSRPYIGGENRRLPGKSSTRCIRSAQNATDLGAPSIPMGRRVMVYYGRDSAKVFHSIPFHSGADLSRPYIGGENKRLPGKSSTRCIRSAQNTTDLGAP